jgi:hypothetical protein
MASSRLWPNHSVVGHGGAGLPGAMLDRGPEYVSRRDAAAGETCHSQVAHRQASAGLRCQGSLQQVIGVEESAWCAARACVSHVIIKAWTGNK